jgi:hypothetical protein
MGGKIKGNLTKPWEDPERYLNMARDKKAR